MTYQFAAAFDNAAGLTALSPQPKSSAIRPARVRAAGSRLKIVDGDLMQNWLFTQITGAEFASLLTAMGLDAYDFDPFSVEATVKTLKNDRSTFINYNAVVSLTEQITPNYIGLEDIAFTLQIIGTPT